MPNPTATIFVPYQALDEAIDDPTIARTNEANVFTEDQTIEGNLIVTGEINPARWLEQRPKIERLEGVPGTPGGVRTLLSETLTAGMSLRHEEALGVGKITVGNYDTQLYQPLRLEAQSVQLVTGVYPPGLVEHLRVHPSGGVSVGDEAAHATDPGLGVVRVQQVQFPAPAVLSADPSTLDCYVEGTWTPVIGGAGGTSGQSYSVQAGLVTRIGRLCFAAFTATLSVKGTITGDLRLFGLPYPPTSLPGAGGGAFLSFSNLVSIWSDIAVQGIAGTTAGRILGRAGPAGTSSDTPLTDADLTNTTGFRGMLIYHV